MKTQIAMIVSGLALMSVPAQAQLDLGVGVDLDTDVELRVGDPYVYYDRRADRRYHSERWYYSDYERSGRYDDRYGGYDCHSGFYYTWERDDRVRYEAQWCFDDDGRRYEARNTRTTVRVR